MIGYSSASTVGALIRATHHAGRHGLKQVTQGARGARALSCVVVNSRCPRSSFLDSSDSSSMQSMPAKGARLFQPLLTPKRLYNFASSQYESAFRDLPIPNTAELRKSALDYLQNFDKESWYSDPICSILNGEKLVAPPSNVWTTKDALGNENGQQFHATPSQVRTLESHVNTFTSPYTDIRPQIRRIEQRLLNEYSGFLIGNQCLDFQKQDGVTEIEESIMANKVERDLNDMLLDDEKNGKIRISRKPIYVSCVSNFTNFLDLFRKTIRDMELGIPCVVLGRSHTVQHTYRWTELLVELMKEEGLDLGMLTYLSCTLDDIKYITSHCQANTGNLYTTCSRELAADIKSSYPNTVSSTGGPNTILATEWTPGVQDAIRMSATIESSGQCTALRHCVVPDTVTAGDVEKMFGSTKGVASAPDALRDEMFDAVFENHAGTSPPAVSDGHYTKHKVRDVYYRVGDALPADGIEEYWRKVVVDFSRTAPVPELDEQSEEKLSSLALWLNKNQPISLGLNAPREKVFQLGRTMFEKTALVVYTVGSTDNDEAPPALSCQARPQEAEVFGEFPPRKSLDVYTKYPVVVPSSTPSYDSQYQPSYLESLSVSDMKDNLSSFIKDIVKDVSSPTAKGFCIELLNYLSDVGSNNPKRGYGTGRTAIWGLQRPPILNDMKTCIHCGANASLDDIAPIFLIFYATNAREQVEVSVDPSNKDLMKALGNHGIAVIAEGNDEFIERTENNSDKYYNLVEVNGPMNHFPMVGQFVSLYFPLGHIKSTMSGDEEFVAYFEKSEKWLKIHED